MRPPPAAIGKSPPLAKGGLGGWGSITNYELPITNGAPATAKHSPPLAKGGLGGLAPLGGLALLLLALLLIGLPPPAAYANGAVRIIADDRAAGPYLLRVGIAPAEPVVGLLHISVLVQQAGTEQPLSGAAVRLRAAGPPESAGAVSADALGTAQTPHIYEGNLELDAAGAWTLTVAVDAEPGAAMLELPLQARPGGPINLGYVAMGAIAALLVVAVAWTALQRNRSRPACS